MPIFPSLLQEIADPPAVLYVRGELLRSDERGIAIVGPRKPSPYGLSVAELLGRKLAAKGVTVVSGLAEGVDAAAHRGALEAGGRTVAFLGSGVDHPYPRPNRRLRRRIEGSGAVVSEFPMGTDPVAWHFPQRNRLIAGFSLGTVVVEAAARSGALSTASHARRSGREVFAVPGPITSKTSAGTNALLKDGAALVRGVDDILDELPAEWRGRLQDGDEKPAAIPRDLPGDEARVLARLSPAEPVTVDVLAREAGIPTGTLLDALVSLEVRRLVRTVPGGRYVRTPG